MIKAKRRFSVKHRISLLAIDKAFKPRKPHINPLRWKLPKRGPRKGSNRYWHMLKNL